MVSHIDIRAYESCSRYWKKREAEGSENFPYFLNISFFALWSFISFLHIQTVIRWSELECFTCSGLQVSK